MDILPIGSTLAVKEPVLICPKFDSIENEPPIKKRKPVSTKSRARKGLRRGKWTDAEVRYAEKLIYCFRYGLIPLKKGTALRIFLAERLNCEPMRVTKKFNGDVCVGRQVYRGINYTDYSSDYQHELNILRKGFLKSIELCISRKLTCLKKKIEERPLQENFAENSLTDMLVKMSSSVGSEYDLWKPADSPSIEITKELPAIDNVEEDQMACNLLFQFIISANKPEK